MVTKFFGVGFFSVISVIAKVDWWGDFQFSEKSINWNNTSFIIICHIGCVHSIWYCNICIFFEIIIYVNHYFHVGPYTIGENYLSH